MYYDSKSRDTNYRPKFTLYNEAYNVMFIHYSEITKWCSIENVHFRVLHEKHREAR